MHLSKSLEIAGKPVMSAKPSALDVQLQCRKVLGSDFDKGPRKRQASP